MTLLPFFCLYGGKWRAAPHYPAPHHRRIIEPFAGGAGYSTRHHKRDIVLVEADPVIAGLWRWLISAPASEVLALPADVPDTVAALGLAPGPSALIGFWLNKGTASPRQRPSAWMRQGLRPRSFWGPDIRERVAGQVGAIRHWKVLEGDFTDAPDDEATWFVDPPYANKAGACYRKRFARHMVLGAWCQARRGQVIACENVGATWLPFRPFLVTKGLEGRRGGKRSAEAIWLNGEVAA